MKGQKKCFNLISLFVLISLLLSGCAKKSEVSATTQQVQKVVNIQALEKQSYSDFLSYSGFVAAKDTKNFSFQLAGKVNEVLVEKGQKIEEGQILAKLDAKDIQMAIDNANESILLANNGIAQTQSAINKINIGIEAEKINLNKIDAGIEAEKLNKKNIETSLEADKITLEKMTNEYDTKISQLELSYNLKKDDFERGKALYEVDDISKQQYDQLKSSFENVEKDYNNAVSNKESDISLQNKSIESKQNSLEMEDINIQNLQHDRELQETKIKDLENDLKTTNLKLEAANIQLKQANIQLEQYNKQLSDSILTSTISGYVLELPVKAGEVTGAGSPIVIVKSGEQVINVGIPVEDYNKLKVGMSVLMSVSGEEFNGIINTVSLYPDEETRTYNVEITPDKNDLATGSLVDVKIAVGDKEGYFAPISAIANIEGTNYIYTLETAEDSNISTVHRIEVEIDMTKAGNNKVLLKNITENLNIIPENVKDIKENDLVTIAN